VQGLADAVRGHHCGAYQLIQRELAAGNLVETGYVVQGKARRRFYKWAHEDDMISTILEAAKCLRDCSTEGEHLADRMLHFLGG
jgi:hypothetical protein